jgi:glycerol-3-phosphate acyltransferase PlsY
MTPIPGLLIPLALAYLAGSFPSSVVLGRLMRRQDPRESGSGNAGATNALRTLGPVPGALTLVSDIAKSLAAVLLVPLVAGLAPPPLLGGRDLAALCALAAVLGHIFPVFARFRGGKGVAVAAAAAGALFPESIPFCLAAFILALGLTGYASVASICAALALPAAVFIGGVELPLRIQAGSLPSVLVLVLPLVIIASHAGNLRRLAAGTEPRFGRAMLVPRILERLGSGKTRIREKGPGGK